jgi:hypothetical protein
MRLTVLLLAGLCAYAQSVPFPGPAIYKAAGGGAGIAHTGTATKCIVTDGGYTATCAYSATTGSLLVVTAIGYYPGATVEGVADGTNTYAESKAAAGTELFLAQWHAANITGGNLTITVSYSNNVNPSLILVDEYTGAATTNAGVLDQTNSAGGASATMSPGAITPSVNGALIRSSCAVDVPSGTDTYTAVADYTLRANNGDSAYNDGAAEDRILGTASAQTASITSSTSRTYVCVVASYKPAS